jgi:16S rRNA (guanine1516-N2)-methyltransferase
MRTITRAFGFLFLLSLTSRSETAAFVTTPGSSADVQRNNEDTGTRRVCVLDGNFESSLAEEIAGSLSLPLVSHVNDDDDGSDSFTHALTLVPYECGSISSHALAIKALNLVDSTRRSSRRRSPKQKKSSKPFFVDLCPPPESRMGKRGSGESGSDLLVKAVGPKRVASSINAQGASICDLTAGLGQDSLVLALSGAAHVHMVERDPIVAALLEDALRRLRLLSFSSDLGSQAELALDLSQRLTLHVGDGKSVIQNLQSNGELIRPDIVYLDPMFPPRTKSAAVKKGMALLHGLLNTQQVADADSPEVFQEENELLGAALSAANIRVVVKRPIRALPLGGTDDTTPRPSYAINGSINRWDVYVK